MTHTLQTAIRVAPTILIGIAVASSAQTIERAGRLELEQLSPDQQILVLESDPDAEPVPIHQELWNAQWLQLSQSMDGTHVRLLPEDGTETGALVPLGCPDEGYSTRAYARDSGNDWPWLPANTLVADDLTLEPGTWLIGCYDVLIYADYLPQYGCDTDRNLTIRIYTECNGDLIFGSEETWTVPPHGGPILLTGTTNIDFKASGTVWMAMTTTSNECDGWYLGQQQYEGSTANVFQLETDCNACINPPTCNPWSGFIAILYGCALPEITTAPADAAICAGGYNQFCCTAEGPGPITYQWQKDDEDIPGATTPCYVATEAGEYQCRVSNTCGGVGSGRATLEVRTGPAIVDQPASGYACLAGAHELCTTADTIGQPTYQWKRNGLNVIGATSSCYAASLPGSYQVVITDDCGTSTSDAAAVTLVAPSTGDLNGDSQTDLLDHTELTLCLEGPEAPIAPDCVCRDIDGNGAIDLTDYAALQTLLLP